MLMIGLGLIYAAYSLGFWGYSEIKGYGLTLGQIMSPKAYTGKWPPAMTDPTSTSTTNGTSGGGSAGGFTGPNPNANPNKPGATGNNGNGGPTDTGPNTLGGSPPNIG